MRKNTNEIKLRKNFFSVLKEAYPETPLILSDFKLIKTTHSWKSLAFMARCQTGKEHFSIFGARDLEDPLSKKKTFQILSYLWKNGFNRAPLFANEPIVFNSGLKLLIYKLFEGKTLWQIIDKKKGKTPVRFLELVGQWAAAFHALKPPAFIPRSAGKLDQQEYRKQESMPELSGARELGKKIVEERAGIRRRLKSLSIIHDDFHAQNIIISPDQKSIAIIDFDKAKIDDPLDDVAEFLIRLDAQLFYLSAQAENIIKLQKTFIQAYQNKRSGNFSVDEKKRIELHLRWTALRLLQYTLETNYANRSHRHSSSKRLCAMEDRFLNIALNPDKFLKPLL